MKIYVDEMPKSCRYCACNDDFYCNLYWQIKEECLEIYENDKERNSHCLLKSIKDHDRAIKQHAYKKGYNDMRIQYELGKSDIKNEKE